MTDTESAAVRVWALLVRDDVPPDPHRALDLVMDAGRGCEIGEALSALHVAAAGWVPPKPNGIWHHTSSAIVADIRFGRLHRIDKDLRTIRAFAEHVDASPNQKAWLAWSDRVDRALSILRACRAVAEGVTT